MLMRYRRLVVVPLAAVVLVMAGSPAGAAVLESGPRVNWWVNADASACFVVPDGAVEAVATANGLVRAAAGPSPLPSAFLMLSGRKTLAAPNSTVTGLESGNGTVSSWLCVPDTHGLVIISGTVVYAFEAQSPYGSHEVVATCSFSPAGPSCG